MSEKRYYWLRLKRDFFKRHDIRIIESMPNGKDYILFYLKLLCESVDHDGNLRFSEQIPYSEEMLATITDTNVDIVRSAIRMFCELDMMEILDDGTFFMREVQKLIGSETEWAEKKRIYRENQRLIEDSQRTLSGQIKTESDKSKSNSKRKSKSNSKNIHGIVVEFSGGDMELSATLYDFIDMRKVIKKPLTERALTMILNKLKKMSNDRNTWIEILNQSILHNWQDVYELKTEQKQCKTITPVVVTEEETDRLLRLTRQMDG